MLNPASPVYLVMRDHGSHGVEGTCYPEKSRANIIEDVWADRDEQLIKQIFELADGLCIDITGEIQEAAGLSSYIAEEEPFTDPPGIGSWEVQKHHLDDPVS
jgi:hypothetical protein